MKRYEVKITDEDLHDMDSIYHYISDVLLAPTNALSQYNRIADAIISLSHYPKRYQLFDVEPEHSMGLHRMVVDNYLVCYCDSSVYESPVQGFSELFNKNLAP